MTARLPMRAHGRAPRAHVAGVTIVEAMIAITILSMMGAMMYSGFVQSGRLRERIADSREQHHGVHAALNKMVRDLSMAYASTHENQANGNPTVQTAFVGTERGSSDRLDFTSFGHRRLYRDAHESDQMEVSYFLARHPERRGEMVLARREQNRVDDDPTEGGRVQILLEDVRGLNFEFLDPQNLEWVQSWDTRQAIGQPNRLPTQVRILVDVADPRDPDREVTIGTRVQIPLIWALNHATYNAR